MTERVQRKGLWFLCGFSGGDVRAAHTFRALPSTSNALLSKGERAAQPHKTKALAPVAAPLREKKNNITLHGSDSQFAQDSRAAHRTRDCPTQITSPTIRSPRTSYQPYQPVEARPACDQSFIDRRDRSAEPGGRGPDDVNKVIVRGVLSQNVPAQRSIASETARTRSVNQQGRPRYNG